MSRPTTRTARLSWIAAAVVIVLANIGGMSPASAQTPAPHDDWQWTIAPYLWGAAMDGTIVIQGLGAEADFSASEILDNLEFGTMAMLMARKGDWGIYGDAVYVALGVTTDMPPADIDPTLGILTIQAVRRLNDVADLTFGARWNHLEAEIDFKPPISMRVDKAQDWLDPVVGVVLRTPGEHRWHVTLLADVGGFGVGSNLTWQLFPSIGWDMSKRSSFEIGYRLIKTDYDTGSGATRFEYDMLYQGPAAGLRFEF